ncbi:MAG TPA: hypothetical protein VHP38_02180 [Ruminiclostridium sp.]|nr:hypothetical protein [Ruminiclostridium sp.]
MREASIEIIRSNRARKCRKCGTIIPAKQFSQKITKKQTGIVSRTEIYYICIKCPEKGGKIDE